MWSFVKKKENLFLKLLLLLYAVMLYMSISVGISYVMMVFSVLVLFLVPTYRLLDRTCTFLILFSLSFALILLAREPSIKIPLYIIAPVAFYVFGRHVTEKLSYKGMVEFIILTILVFALNTYIITLFDVQEVGLVNPYRRMGEFESADSALAATLFGLNVSLGFVGLPAFFIKPPIKIRLYYLLLLSFALSLLTVVHLINRTGIVVFLMCSLILLFYSSNRQAARVIVVIAVLTIIIMSFIPSVHSFFKDVGEAYSAREELDDVGVGTLGGRLDRWVDAFQRIFTNPFGWNEINNYYKYVHNMWLDIARRAGIIPFIFMVVASFVGTKKTLRLYRYKSNSLIALLIGLLAAMFTSALVEPVMDGFELYFYLMCMVWGIAAQYYSSIINNRY